MPRTAIVDAAGAILVLDPPLDAQGNAILPEPQEGYRAVELSDKDAARLDTPNARFIVTDKGQLRVEPVKAQPDPRAADRAAVAAKAKGDPAFASLARLLGVLPPEEAPAR